MAHAVRHLVSLFAGLLPFGRRGAWANRGLPTAVFLALSACSAAYAQAPRTAEQAVRFTVFSARPVADLRFAPRIGAAPQKTVFYPTARSPLYEFRGAMPLRFTDDHTGAVVAEAAIPSEIRRALLLFLPIEPAPTAGLRYRIAVLDDTAAHHGPGGLVIINLSGLALTGTVGTNEVTLKDGLNPVLPVGTSAKVMLRTSVKGRALQSYADTVALKASERALLILFPPFYKGSVEVQSRLLVDSPSVSPPPPGTPAGAKK